MRNAVHRPELDGLRGIAAYAVFLAHASSISFPEAALFNGLFAWGGGQIGVMLFFVLSGYLMATLYLDRPFNRAEAGLYLVRRFARIAPLFYLVVLAAWGTTLWSETHGGDFMLYPVTTENVLRYLVFAQGGVSILWTVPIEVQFYLCFMLLWALHSRSADACYVLLVVVLWLSFYFQWDLDIFHPLALAFFIAFFLAGVGISRVHWPSAPKTWSLLFVLSLSYVVALYPKLYAHVFGQPRWLLPDFATSARMWRDPAYLMAAGGLLVATLNAPIARAILGHPVMRWAGTISYSVYLLHQPVLLMLKNLTDLEHTPALMAAVAFVLVTGLSSAAYLLVERPARDAINASITFRRRSNPMADH